MAQLTLRTWQQQLLQDVHSVAQINVKLRDKRQAVVIKKLQRADTRCAHKAPEKAAVLINSSWCLCLAVLLIGCALVLFTATGGEKSAFCG